MKVLVNGCSHIEGNELHQDITQRRQLTWPNYVENWQVTNIGMGASSNDSITRRTIAELEKNTYDFVYIQWSYFDRIELQIPWHTKYACEFEWFCINAGNAEQMVDLNRNGPFIHELAKNIYFKQFDNTWRENYSFSQMIVLQSYLKYKNINYVFGFAVDDVFESENVMLKLLDQSKFNRLSWINFCKKQNFKKIKSHYEHAAHLEYANVVSGMLKNLK